jgi:hypothetical protein
MRPPSASRPANTPYLPYVPAAEVDPVELARTRADLRRRLARACAGLPPADFDALVDAMARRALRWAARP